MGVTLSKVSSSELDAARTFERLYDEHVNFVWATLYRLGARDADLEDLTQEVFVVVHRRLTSFRTECSVRSWLYSICRRILSTYRKRVHFRREQVFPESEGTELASQGSGPEEAAMASEARRRLDLLLDRLSDDKRIVFVMFELELIPANDIARLLSIPVGTVHSRIHAARLDIERLAAKLDLEPLEKKNR